MTSAEVILYADFTGSGKLSGEEFPISGGDAMPLTGTGLETADLILIALYFIALIAITLKGNLFLKKTEVSVQVPSDLQSGSPEAERESSFLLSGRKLTLPAFVATLVSTWYGGILGVGEFGYQFGISQWIVMGLPYYIFAVLFAVFLAGKIRGNAAFTIPDAIGNVYGQSSSRLGAALVFLLVSPAPYILMVALLAQFVLGVDGWAVTIGVALFSALYVGVGGFGAVVRTDKLQVLLMYAGFGVLLFSAWKVVGSPVEVWGQLEDYHRDPSGGQPFSYLLVWFFIALWTFVDPAFHQRAAAAKDVKTARNGIFVSVGFWFLFDMATLFTALYAVVLLPGLDNPALVYPLLADVLLPVGFKGLFILTLIATIMSTLDSFLFLSGQTLGRDFMSGYRHRFDPVWLTRVGIGLSAVIGVVLVWLVPSVIGLWYVIGSVLIPGLLLPILGVYYPFFRVRNSRAPVLIVMPVLVSFGWLLAGAASGDSVGYAFLGIEPFYPGMMASGALYLMFRNHISLRR